MNANCAFDANIDELKNRAFHVAQLGSREYYNYPRVLHSLECLASFSTDIWVPWASQLPLPGGLARLKSRFSDELENYPVRSQGLVRQLLSARTRSSCRYSNWLEQGQNFAKWASTNICKSDITASQATFGFTCANLEIMEMAKSNGALAVHGQIDPGIEWYKTVLNEQEDWGNIEENIKPPTESFIHRLKQEWQVADYIIANSQHTKISLIKQGVDKEKIAIVPLAYQNTNSLRQSKNLKPRKKVRVLFVGNVSLSKGFPYFAQAAEKLGAEFEFIAAGAININKSFLQSKSWPVVYLNHINRSQLFEEYKKADVLVFPTLSDGFGMVQLEAMSFGLPVLATNCCAQVVEDGISGFIIPPKDSDAIVEKLLLIKGKPELYRFMSTNALDRADKFSLDTLKHVFK